MIITPELIKSYIKFLKTLEEIRAVVSEYNFDFHFVANTMGYDLKIEKIASEEEIIDEMVEIFNSRNDTKIESIYKYHSAVTPGGKELRSPPEPGYPDSWIENGVNYIIDRITNNILNASVDLEITSHNILFMTRFQDRRHNLTWGSFGRNGNLSRIDLPVCLMSDDHLMSVISNCSAYAERTIFFTMCEELDFRKRKKQFEFQFDDFLYEVLRQAVDRETKTINVSQENYQVEHKHARSLMLSIISFADKDKTKEHFLNFVSLSINLYLNMYGENFGIKCRKKLIDYCIEITRKYNM